MTMIMNILTTAIALFALTVAVAFVKDFIFNDTTTDDMFVLKIRKEGFLN